MSLGSQPSSTSLRVESVRTRPLLVTVLALLSLAAGLYLLALAALRFAEPNSVSLMAGRSLLGEFVLAGPYAFLIAAPVFLVNALGLWKLNIWARRLTLLLAIAGGALALGPASSALSSGDPIKMIFGALPVILRILVVFYLTQDYAKQAFEQTNR